MLLTLFVLALSSTGYAQEQRGSLRGAVLFDDETAPADVTISLSRIRAGFFSLDSEDNKFLHIQNNTFTVDALPEGRYSLTILGDEFLSLSRAEVIIAPNKETDLGSLTVSRGKTLRGVVLDAKGAPVSGALIAADDTLFIYNKQKPIAARTAISGADGSFSLQALPAAPLFLFATHEALGDSSFVVVGATQEEASIALAVGGEVSGLISYDGRATPAVISAIPLLDGELSRAHLFCRTSNGRYSLSLAPGEYLLVADLSKDNTEAIYLPSKVQRVKVESGKALVVELELPKGATVKITPQKDLSKKADWASFYLLQGDSKPKDAAALEALEAQLTPEELRRTSMHLNDTEALIEDVLPGRYLLCGYTTRAGGAPSAVTCQALTVSAKAKRVSMKLSAPSAR